MPTLHKSPVLYDEEVGRGEGETTLAKTTLDILGRLLLVVK